MFRKMSILLTTLLLLAFTMAACTAEPQVVEVEVTREVEVVRTETEIVEVEVEQAGETVTIEVTREVVVEVEVAPETAPVDRTGAWVDTVVVIEEPSAEAAVNRLEVGDIDIYAF
jgi:starvation-inducible outer membrane lipoprotein